MNRTRRLRKTDGIRRLVRENKLTIDDLIYPLFIEEGENIEKEIVSMPGIKRWSLDTLHKELDEVVALDIPAVLLFGIPAEKDEIGKETWNNDGIIQQAVRYIKKEYPSLYVISDVCFCEYTSHGHCGVIHDNDVDNDATLPNIAKQVISHAKAGVDMVAPSGMMDGTIETIREALDNTGFYDLPIMGYSVKYASAFYGPFRDAADSAPTFGDRRTYQMDPSNRDEGLREANFDDAEGADILMVKPAMSYLDIVRDLKTNFDRPIACYNVSGEYAMVKAAAEKGWIDGERVMMESLLSMKRAGADIIITYFAKEVAKVLARKNKTEGDAPLFYIKNDYKMSFKKSEKLYNQGLKHLVGAVNSPVRAYSSVGGNPLFIEKAKGSTITDVDGNNYVDLVLSYGPTIIGHRHKKVQKAVAKALQKGYTFGATTKGEIKMAKMVCDAFPGMDKVRFVNSGTEAVFSAIRLARAFTGYDKIIKFSGCYHGHADALLVAAGSGLATLSLPGSAGVPAQAVENTLISEFNNIDSVEKHLADHSDIAAVIIEPIAGNMGVIQPSDEFIKELRDLTKAAGVLLIADEVMTGFRSTFGGAQEVLGFEADITCLGKVIGGGFPVGAYGARNEIMECVAPLGDMYQAGTLSGNPIAMACGMATLKELKKQDPYTKFDAITAQIEGVLLDAAKENGIDLQVNRFGSMFNPFFTKEEVVDFKSAQTSDTSKFATFFWAMTKNGVFLPPSQFESWFLSTALTKKDLKKIEKAIKVAMKAVAEKA